MAPGYHDGLVYVATVPVTVDRDLPAPARSASSGRSTARPAKKKLALRHRARKTSGGTRRSTPAAASGTRPPSTARARSTSAPATRRRCPGTPEVPLGLEPAGLQPLHRLDGQARREDRQDGVVLPADPAQHLRLGLPGPADPGQRRRQGTGDRRRQVGRRRRARRQDRQAGLEAAGRHPQRPRQRPPLRDAGRILEDQDRRGLPRPARRRDRADGDRRQDALRAGRQPLDDGRLRRGTRRNRAPRPANWSRSTSPPARSSGTKKLPQPAYGAPTVVNDLVFATTFEGGVYALDAKSAAKSGRRPCRPGSTPASSPAATT